MYGYRVYIWAAVHAHDSGEFSHYTMREKVIHLSEQKLFPTPSFVSPYVTLKKGKVVGNTDIGDEFIYSVDYLGEMRIKVVHEYV